MSLQIVKLSQTKDSVTSLNNNAILLVEENGIIKKATIRLFDNKYETEVINSLSNNSTTAALSANMGRILNYNLNATNYNLNATNISVNENREAILDINTTKIPNLITSVNEIINTSIANVQNSIDDINNNKIPDLNIKIQSSGVIGSYLLYALPTNPDPDHYLYCNGAEISRSEFSSLFGVIGTTYGAGDGSTTFNIPKFDDGRFMAGPGGNRADFGTVQDDAIRNITGYVSQIDLIRSLNSQGALSSENAGGDHWGTNSTSGSRALIRLNANNNASSYGNPMAGHANGSDIHPKNMVVGVFIKYR